MRYRAIERLSIGIDDSERGGEFVEVPGFDDLLEFGQGVRLAPTARLSRRQVRNIGKVF